MTRARSQRLLVQTLCLIAAVVLLWPLLPWDNGPKYAVQISPFVAICASIATRAVGLGTGIGIALAILALLRRRWFCRYICPTGLLLEGISRIGMRRTSWWANCPPLGRYAAGMTLVGAIFGYPMLLWLDPIAIFASPFAIRGTNDLWSAVLAGICLGILLPLTLLSGMFWCVRICPLGGLQDLLVSIKPLLASTLTATGTSMDKQFAGLPLARRTFLACGAGAGLGLLGLKTGETRAEEAPLRPPGALSEEHFTGVCIRCGNCANACPSRIIHPDSGKAGLAGLLAPLLRYDRDKYCAEDCNACTQVCPSGALQPLDLQQKNRYVIGEALVDTTVCLLTLGKKDCDACMQACPFAAVSIYWDDEAYLAYPVVDPYRCNGCGACEIDCPTEIVKAISVWTPLPLTEGDGTLSIPPRFLRQ